MITLATPTGTISLTLPDPHLPYISYTRPAQRTQITESGNTRTITVGNPQLVMEMRFGSLTAEQYAATVSFIRDTLIYSVGACTITGHDGVAQKNMHYTSGVETAQAKKGDIWSLTLKFEQAMRSSVMIERNLLENPNLDIDADGKIAGWEIAADSTPAPMRNVEIDEDFASTALEVEDTDSDIEWFIAAEKIPISDLRYTISGRVNRTLGNRRIFLYVTFFDSTGNPIDSTGNPTTGWTGQANTNYYYMGSLATDSPNDTWNLFSVAFGPGSATYIPPSAHSFHIGTFMIQSGVGAGSGNVTARFSDFSIIASI